MRRFTERFLPSVVALLAASGALAERPSGRFLDVKPVAGIDVSSGEDTPIVSADGLELYFDSSFVGGPSDLWVATRTNRNDPFQTVTTVGGVNSGTDEDPGSISPDGLTLYFGSNRGGFGRYDIHQATRSNLQSSFGNVTNLGAGVNSSITDNFPFVTADGLNLYFHRHTDGSDHRLWTATRASTDEPFGNPQDLGDVVNGSPTLDSWRPTVSSDLLTLFFSDGPSGSSRPGGQGGADIWVAFRDDTAEPFGQPVNLNDAWPGSDVNGPSYDGQAYIAGDWPAFGSKLYFTTTRGGISNGDIWEATWILTGTPFDYNGNGYVEQGDLDLVLLNWGDELADPAEVGWYNDIPSGAVDQEELDALLLNWGNRVDVFGANGVPEPATWALMLSALTAAALYGGRIKNSCSLPLDGGRSTFVDATA